jgi:DNA-binding transcriptional regulator YiaG
LTSYTISGRIRVVKKRTRKEKKQWDGKTVQALRRHLGLTQRELSERLGTRQQTISEWETGIYRPRGTSATLLTFIAEQAKFKYQAGPEKKP